MGTIKATRRKSQEKSFLHGSVASLQAFLKEPAALTLTEAQELDRIVRAERAVGVTDFRSRLRRRRQ